MAWGVWAIFVRLAERSISPELTVVVSYATAGLMATVYLLWTPRQPTLAPEGLGFAVAAGLATGVGSLLYYAGLEVGEVSVVSTTTGLYVVVAAILGILVFQEGLTLRKLAGVLAAVVAVLLLAE